MAFPYDVDLNEPVEQAPLLAGTKIEFDYNGDNFCGMVVAYNTATGKYLVRSLDNDVETVDVEIHEEQITRIFHN